MDLTVALVPQKIKAGVDISPCDVDIFPILALELGLFFKISKKLLNVFWQKFSGLINKKSIKNTECYSNKINTNTVRNN